MATNILLQFVPEGLNALQAQIANGDATKITRYELTEETITGTTWNPSIYYRQDNPQDIGAVSLYNAVDAPNTQQVLVMDLLLNQTVPVNTAYTSVNAGWVNSSTNPAIINLLNFCLFIYDPVSGVDVPFLIGTFLNIDTQLPQAVLKFSNNYITSLPGNVIDIFNNTKLTPTNPDSIQYEIVQRPDAQIRYINQGIELLPTPTANTPNAYVVNTYNTLAWSNYYLWYFSNYYDEISDSSVIGVTGTTFNSPDLAAKVNIYPEEIFVAPNVIGEIYGSNGIMKKCFYITGVSGSIFSTSTTLPAFEAGDMVKVFFSLAKIAGKNFLKLTTQAATSVLSTSATLNGTLISFINSTTNLTGFDYKKTTDTNYTRVGMGYNDVLGPYIYNLSGLDLSTTYQYRAVGTDTNNQFTSFGEVVQFTTGSVTPPVFDFQLNITGTVDGPSNIALNTTNIPDVVNGAVNNATGLMTATANNCASNSLEVEQGVGDPDFTAIQPLFTYNPYKLTIDPTTTSTSIVVTDRQSGLLTNGSQLIVDDTGDMKIVQAGSVVQTTIDNGGAAWNITNLPSSGTGAYANIVYGNGLYITTISASAGSGALNRYITSPDGINWTTRVSPSGINVNYIRFANNAFFMGYPNNGATYRSTDGISWSLLGGTIGFIWGIAYGNGIFVAVKTVGVGSTGYVYTSTDGITWTDTGSTINVSVNYTYSSTPLIFANGAFYCVRAGGVSRSIDGITWSSQNLTGGGSQCMSITYGNGIFIVGTQSGGQYRSTDGITWSPVINAYGNAYSGAYGNGLFMLTNGDTQVITSPDGLTWNPHSTGLLQGRSLIYANGKFTLLDDAYDRVGSSDASLSYQYTCTSLTSVFGAVPLTNAPTWCAKGGQVFQSAVYATTSPTPTYTTDTIDSLTRATDTLTITMTQRPAAGRYVRVKTTVNNQDIMSRYAANLYI